MKREKKESKPVDIDTEWIIKQMYGLLSVCFAFRFLFPFFSSYRLIQSHPYSSTMKSIWKESDVEPCLSVVIPLMIYHSCIAHGFFL